MTLSPSTLTAMRERAEAIVNSGIMSHLALDVLDLLAEVERLRGELHSTAGKVQSHRNEWHAVTVERDAYRAMLCDVIASNSISPTRLAANIACARDLLTNGPEKP